MADFAETIATAYATDGAAVDLGRGVHDGAVALDATVKLPLRMVNRHGLIAGATGTGKTKTLQGLTVRLIRSKGVGVYFITQTPRDVPSEILGQLGNRVQHALRAFTPEDAKALKATVSTFPKSPFYDMETLLTSMGIGEAAVTILSESGVPTPVVHTRMTPPASRMGPADDIEGKAKASPLWAKYGTRVDNQSAREILAARLAPAAAPAASADQAPTAPHQQAAPQRQQPAAHRQPEHRQPAAEHKEAAGALSGGVAAVSSFLKSKEGKKLQQEVVRGVFGMLKKRL